MNNQLEMKDQEINSLRNKVSELESQLVEAQKLIQKHILETKEVDNLKMKSADTLTKAKSVIFENTKMIKNQELQIEALNQQVNSLRDVVKITKELLEIRNLEVDQLESKIYCMEEKYKAEKERQDLMHRKLEQMIRHNGELKREYEAQLCLFQALRERYDERELAKGVVDTLKADITLDKNKMSQKQPDQCETNNTQAQENPKEENVELEKDETNEVQSVTENENISKEVEVTVKCSLDVKKEDENNKIGNCEGVNNDSRKTENPPEVADNKDMNTIGSNTGINIANNISDKNNALPIEQTSAEK